MPFLRRPPARGAGAPGTHLRPAPAILAGCLLLALAALLAQPPGLAGQERLPGTGWAFVPFAGFTGSGTRYAREGPGGGAPPDDLEGTVSPRTGALLGAEVLAPLAPTLQLGAAAAWSRSSYESKVGPAQGDEARFVGGSQELLRGSLGVVLRIRPAARGYFTAGGVMQRRRALDPFRIEDRDATEWGGYLGAGLLVGGGRHRLRLDGRLLGMALPDREVQGQDGLYRSRSFALDFALTLGLVLSPG